MRHIFALVLCASCASPPQQSAFARVPWLSAEATLAAIEAWPDGASDQAPWAVYVAIPNDLASPDFDRIHRAIRARGYGAPHSAPSMLDVTTALTARLALADPVGQDFNVSAAVAHLLWLHSIPFNSTQWELILINTTKRSQFNQPNQFNQFSHSQSIQTSSSPFN